MMTTTRRTRLNHQRQSRFSSLSFFLSVVALQLPLALACNFCPDNLWDCSTRGPCSGMNGFYVENFPSETCGSIYQKAVQGSRNCGQVISKYRHICCDNSGNNGGQTQAPQTLPPVASAKQAGTEPECHICFDESYPGKPYTQIHSNFLQGSPTCHELYYDGRLGYVGGAICYPLQLFAQDPCGCGMNPPPVASPDTPKPNPAPVNNGPPSFPPRRVRPPGASKSSLKLSYGYRVRGSTNNRKLRGEKAGSASNKTSPEQIPAVNEA